MIKMSKAKARNLAEALEYAQSFYMVGDTVLVIGEDSNRESTPLHKI
jgi:hypothetical protein